MKKSGLFLLAICAIMVSCSKTVRVPTSYSVQSPSSTAVQDVYIPDSGTYSMPVLVKFLSGYDQDSVTLVLNGLPSDIKATPDTITAIPTYTANFVFTTNHAVQAKYPLTIVATSAEERPQTYNFNLTVVPANCATVLAGTFTGTNACTARNYTYSATVSAGSSINTININNLGGYGLTTNTYATLNCNQDSLYIPSQNIGNNTTLEGYGTFTANSLTIYYTASSTPGGAAETCTSSLSK